MATRVLVLVLMTAILALAAEDTTKGKSCEAIPPNANRWHITMEFDGGTPGERKGLGWHVVDISSNGDLTITLKIGGEASFQTWKNDKAKLSAEELISVFSATRALVNNFQAIERPEKDVIADGNVFTLTYQCEGSSISVEKRGMKSYGAAGTEVADLIRLFNEKTATVKKISTR